jgi:hypothetical protein
MSLNHILLCCHWGRCWCRSAHSASAETPFPEKYLVAGAGPFCRQARPQWGTPPIPPPLTQNL